MTRRESPEKESRAVLIADDDAGVRAALQRVVDSTEDFRCVGSLDSADMLVAAIIKLRPEIVMLDLVMPGRNVIEAIMEICQYLRYACSVVVVSAVCDRMRVQTVMTLGAAAYVVKDDGPDAILEALRAVTARRRWLSPAAGALFDSQQLEALLSAKSEA